MPELAEVEYYRQRWNPGLGQKVLRVFIRKEIGVFQELDAEKALHLLTASKFQSSEARGKQMVFRFSRGAWPKLSIAFIAPINPLPLSPKSEVLRKNLAAVARAERSRGTVEPEIWLGIHLGMTGQLRIEERDFKPTKHDHLALYQAERTLVFRDPRKFGKVRFAQGREEPSWWSKLPPPIESNLFTVAALELFLKRHARIPIKAALLLQEGFPGIGNWMADEILWRAGLNPRTKSGKIGKLRRRRLWRTVRFVCRAALRHVSPDFSDPPKAWLYHERWEKSGRCPIHGIQLRRERIGGRTTAWCSVCQS